MQEIYFYAYETRCRVWIEEREDAQEILQTCRAIAWRTEKLLNMFDEASELSLLCQNYFPGECKRISPALFSFLAVNLRMAGLSEGSFDFTIGALSRRWNFGSGCSLPPQKEEVSVLLQGIGWQHVHLVEGNGVVFDLPGMVLDPGGSGKGFAMDMVVGYLKEKGVRQAWIDFGGNLYVLGDKTWEIGIRHPKKPGEVICTLQAKNQAVSTSACYEHAVESGGRCYGHILNPANGETVDSSLSSVTVLASSAVYADMLSTAVYLVGKEQGLSLITRVKETLGEEISCLVVP